MKLVDRGQKNNGRDSNSRYLEDLLSHWDRCPAGIRERGKRQIKDGGAGKKEEGKEEEGKSRLS